jgi:hypothetical protein
MKWSKKKPTKEGWWFLKVPESGNVSVVRVRQGSEYLLACGFYSDSYTGLSTWAGFKWAGPIPEPEE